MRVFIFNSFIFFGNSYPIYCYYRGRKRFVSEGDGGRIKESDDGYF